VASRGGRRVAEGANGDQSADEHESDGEERRQRRGRASIRIEGGRAERDRTTSPDDRSDPRGNAERRGNGRCDGRRNEDDEEESEAGGGPPVDDGQHGGHDDPERDTTDESAFVRGLSEGTEGHVRDVGSRKLSRFAGHAAVQILEGTNIVARRATRSPFACIVTSIRAVHASLTSVRSAFAPVAAPRFARVRVSYPMVLRVARPRVPRIMAFEGMLEDPVVQKYLHELVGPKGMPVAAAPPDGEVTDEELSERLDLELNDVRRALFILYENDLATYRRVRDEDSGWLTYLWTFHYENVPANLHEEMDRLREALEERRKYERDNEFYLCEVDSIRFEFDEAMDFGFECPECGSPLESMENDEMAEAIDERLEALETELGIV